MKKKKIAIGSDTLRTPLLEPCLTDKRTAYYRQDGQQDFLIIHLKKKRNEKVERNRVQEGKRKRRRKKSRI
jgi:hypothetical protein